MATVDQLKHDSWFKNFLSVSRALHVTGDCLETFTENGLKSVHQKIIAILGHLPRCNHNCSQVFGRDIRRWCHTCTQWQQELSKFAIFPAKILWKKMHSNNWPNSFVDIAEVFVPSGWTNRISLQDLSTQMNIWINCSEFPRNISQLAIDLKTERNHIAHCSQNLTNNEKQRAFQSIDNVLVDPDVVQTILNYQDVQRILTDLKQNDLYQHETYMTRAVGELQTTINTLNTKFKKLKNEIRRAGSWNLPLLTSVSAILIAILALVVFKFWSLHQESGLSLQHAVSEEDADDKYRCPAGLKRDSYLRTHNGECYQFVNYETSWSNAKHTCARRGGQLIVINRRDIQVFVEQSLVALSWPLHGLWIGATDEDNEMEWRWVTDHHSAMLKQKRNIMTTIAARRSNVIADFVKYDAPFDCSYEAQIYSRTEKLMSEYLDIDVREQHAYFVTLLSREHSTPKTFIIFFEGESVLLDFMIDFYRCDKLKMDIRKVSIALKTRRTVASFVNGIETRISARKALNLPMFVPNE